MKFEVKSKGLLLHLKRTRFAPQKDSFCKVKGLVLRAKRTPFEKQAFSRCPKGAV